MLVNTSQHKFMGQPGHRHRASVCRHSPTACRHPGGAPGLTGAGACAPQGQQGQEGSSEVILPNLCQRMNCALSIANA